jgi:hypothetical protein
MNNFSPAPIVIFSYNRLAHLKITISALKKNYLAKSSELIIFSDGPKKNIENDNTKILEIRNYLHKINGFKKITIINRNKNLGLSKNIIAGISQVIKKYKKAIVLEDDLVPNKFFLKYMNSGLKIYKSNKNVASIHAYVYPIENIKKKINQNTFFIKGADCWGWATWLRAWDTFDKNGKKLLNKIKKKKLIGNFNFNNSYNYFQMNFEVYFNSNRKVAPQNIMYDRRVVRGNTFAALVIPVNMQPDPALIEKQRLEEAYMK